MTSDVRAASQLSVTRGVVELRPGEPLALYTVEARPSEPAPADLVLVLDASGSLAGPPRARGAAALRTLVASLAPDRRVALVLATSPAIVVAPLAPLASSGPAIDAALERCPPGGPATLARACELAGLEVERGGRGATVVLVSDLAWGALETEALARLEARGAALILVEATSAFTPPVPARTPRVTLPLPEPGAEAAPLEVARALADLALAGAPAPLEGWLEVELARAPVAWFAGDPLEACAPGAVARARIPLERGAARLAFATRDTAEVLGEARLSHAGAPASRPLRIARQEASVARRAPVGASES